MAVNMSRSMRGEFELGVVENTFMQLQPGWSINANPPTERLLWPNYQQVLRHGEGPKEMLAQAPREHPAGGMYATKRQTGGQGGKFALIESLNAGGS